MGCELLRAAADKYIPARSTPVGRAPNSSRQHLTRPRRCRRRRAGSRIRSGKAHREGPGGPQGRAGHGSGREERVESDEGLEVRAWQGGRGCALLPSLRVAERGGLEHGGAAGLLAGQPGLRRAKSGRERGSLLRLGGGRHRRLIEGHAQLQQLAKRLRRSRRSRFSRCSRLSGCGSGRSRRISVQQRPPIQPRWREIRPWTTLGRARRSATTLLYPSSPPQSRRRRPARPWRRGPPTCGTSCPTAATCSARAGGAARPL